MNLQMKCYNQHHIADACHQQWLLYSCPACHHTVVVLNLAWCHLQNVPVLKCACCRLY
jgi:hypothetical protein